MTVYAFDGASPFDLAAAKANGAVVITGYVIGQPGGFAPIDRARVDEILALGMGFLPNAELAANFFDTCTLAEAKAMGAEAATACTALGLPADGSVAIPGSFDFDFGANRYPEMWQKLAAYGSGMPGFVPRAYGPQGFLDYLTGPGRMPGTKHWLMMSTFGRPYNPSSPSVCMVQEHTLSGAWLNSPVAATDISTITDLEAVHAYGGTDMPLTAADAKLVVQELLATPIQRTDSAGKPISGVYSVRQWLTMDPGVAVESHLQPTVDRITRLSAGLDTGTPQPFAKQGELTLAVRALAGRPVPSVPTAEQVADAVIPRVPAAQAVVDVQAVIDGILAKLPSQATKEEIAQAFRDNLTTNPLKITT